MYKKLLIVCLIMPAIMVFSCDSNKKPQLNGETKNDTSYIQEPPSNDKKNEIEKASLQLREIFTIPTKEFIPGISIEKMKEEGEGLFVPWNFVAKDSTFYIPNPVLNQLWIYNSKGKLVTKKSLPQECKGIQYLDVLSEDRIVINNFSTHQIVLFDKNNHILYKHDASPDALTASENNFIFRDVSQFYDFKGYFQGNVQYETLSDQDKDYILVQDSILALAYKADEDENLRIKLYHKEKQIIDHKFQNVKIQSGFKILGHSNNAYWILLQSDFENKEIKLVKWNSKTLTYTISTLKKPAIMNSLLGEASIIWQNDIEFYMDRFSGQLSYLYIESDLLHAGIVKETK